MNKTRLSFLSLLLLPAAMVPAAAQDIGRVMPAATPLPLPGTKPVPPDRLRSHNPWNLPMTGDWRFKLTHGQIVDGRFTASLAAALGVSASSSEPQNPPQNAFDGSGDTRWCASGGTFPEWLQVDMRQPRHVTGVTLAWERPAERYRFRIEGSADGKGWTTLADKTAEPGMADGPVAVTPADVRFLRVTVTGSQSGWASLREFQIRVLENGQEVAWKPQPDETVSAQDDAFTQAAFDDKKWDTIPVPSNWEMLGYSLPTYDSVDDTVGLYRRWVTVPASFAGKRVYWRFDGSLEGTEVYVNGQRAGYHESGYTAFDVDITGLVKPGERNLFALRVSKSVPSSDCETGDFQCMGGVYRETSLFAVPETHVSDLTVRTALDSRYKDATLSASVTIDGAPGRSVAVTGSLVGADGRRVPVTLAGQGTIGADGTGTIDLSAPVTAPKLWSAEKPNLYYLMLTLSEPIQPPRPNNGELQPPIIGDGEPERAGGRVVENVEQRFGFRQVEIKDGVLLWNGKAIKCTGTCRHDFWADKGFALTDKEWNKDLTMMKAANINAIRTSHYNHAARFLELCDEKGMYILDEIPFCWVGDQVKDPKYAPYLLQRAQETLARDKNRPCVLAWSIGNENPVGPDTQAVHDLVTQLDPTRPSFASCSGPGDVKGQVLRDGHYPSPGDVDNYAKDNSTHTAVVFSEHPHMFYQKETQDYDPGASDLWSETLIKTWDKLWRDPTILGSFIWEWQNQGIADKNADRTSQFWYGKDHLRQENNKGIVDAFRHPKAEYWIVKQAYTKVFIPERTVTPQNGVFTVPITNRYDFTDLGELSCRWSALRGTDILKKGVSHIACAPGAQVQAAFPAPAGATALRLEFDGADGVSVADALLTVPGSPVPQPPAGIPGGGVLAVRDAADALTVSSADQQVQFDKGTGAIRSWRVRGRAVVVGGPILNLGEAKEGNWKGYYQAAQPPVIDGASVAAQSEDGGAVRVTVTGAIRKAAGEPPLGTLTVVYDIAPDARIGVRWTVDWTGDEMHLWEAGLKFLVPKADSRMSWWRDSYFTVYPAGHLGEPVGTARAGDVSFRASKRALHWLALTGGTGGGVVLLAADTPLIGRADAGAAATTLFASREVAGPQDLSGSWVSDHDIVVKKGSPVSGAFTLRAAGE